jgi:short subunit dehydrogenase-like uncharacterized protein
MLYGANGYTGELIAREAKRRGLSPVLAGRSEEKIRPLAHELGLECRSFSLDDAPTAAKQLEDVEAVLHCAGPFIHTSIPMVRACLASRTHYLDITGEIAVFETIMSRSDVARQRGVALIPGVGFDVVPSDCLAAMLAEKLPDANDLILAFYTPGASLSRGTMRTMIEGLGEGGAIRRDGKITRVPMAWDVREIPFAPGPKTAMTIPWGDVSTAFYTTGIPNIRVYFATAPRAIRDLRRSRFLLPLARVGFVKKLLLKRADRQAGPDERARATSRVHLWGRVANEKGEEAVATVTTPDGYAFTVQSSLAAIERLLGEPARGGSFTPASYFGAGFARSLPGVETSS